MIQIQAVDVDKVTRFWQGVPHQMPVSIVKGDTPSMRLVITALSGSLNQEVDSLIAKGAELVERTDYEALMKDPEGNEFVVEIDPDLTGL